MTVPIFKKADKHEDFHFEVYPFITTVCIILNRRLWSLTENSGSVGGHFLKLRNCQLQPTNHSVSAIIQADGLPIYDGKGNFTNQIQLSNNGLLGKGKLEYLTSLTWSDDFIFMQRTGLYHC